ncbi:MAG TPA: hypothetical protein VNF73_16965 [Candidatus Saccharimonadales bacterium]|nr:hypothetical protein [Candidatus Saccharimonadales bacterium]
MTSSELIESVWLPTFLEIVGLDGLDGFAAYRVADYCAELLEMLIVFAALEFLPETEKDHYLAVYSEGGEDIFDWLAVRVPSFHALVGLQLVELESQIRVQAAGIVAIESAIGHLHDTYEHGFRLLADAPERSDEM